MSQSKSSREYGGKSVWGATVDPILSKYHWTLDCLLWQISYQNLLLLQLDEVTIVEKRARVKGKSQKSGTVSSKKMSYGDLIQLLSGANEQSQSQRNA